MQSEFYQFWRRSTADQGWREDWQETDDHWSPPGVELVDDKVMQCQQISDYVENTLFWLERQQSNEDSFPALRNVPFPPQIGQIFKQHFAKLFSINVLLVANQCFQTPQTAPQLYSLTKHFIYFGLIMRVLPYQDVYIQRNDMILAVLNSYRRDKIRYQTG